jgi:hypothetical protein
MKTITYIVQGIHGKETLMYECEGRFYILQNGAFGEKDMSLREINYTRAQSLIKFMQC